MDDLDNPPPEDLIPPNRLELFFVQSWVTVQNYGWHLLFGLVVLYKLVGYMNHAKARADHKAYTERMKSDPQVREHLRRVRELQQKQVEEASAKAKLEAKTKKTTKKTKPSEPMRSSTYTRSTMDAIPTAHRWGASRRRRGGGG